MFKSILTTFKMWLNLKTQHQKLEEKDFGPINRSHGKRKSGKIELLSIEYKTVDGNYKNYITHFHYKSVEFVVTPT